MNTDLVSIYNNLTDKVWQRMVEMLGIHTVIVLIQRTVWLTKEQYEEARNIKFSKEGISYDKLMDNAGPEHSKIIIQDFFANITGVLTKLIGEKIADELKQEINQKLEGE